MDKTFKFSCKRRAGQAEKDSRFGRREVVHEGEIRRDAPAAAKNGLIAGGTAE